MNWTEYPNNIYLINLAHRKDRLDHAIGQLGGYQIPFTVFEAVENTDGRRGIAKSLELIFKANLKAKRLLVFEDDIQWLQNPNDWMPVFIEQLEHINYDLFYLGVNPTREITEKKSKNILPLMGGYALHAVIWSRSGMDKFLDMPMELPIDEAVVKYIQADGKCFCVWPTIATQYKSFSDIERQEVDYEPFLVKRYREKTKTIK